MKHLLDEFKYTLDRKGSIETLFQSVGTFRKRHLLNIYNEVNLFLDYYNELFAKEEIESLLFTAKYHDVGYNKEILYTSNHGLDLVLYLLKYSDVSELTLKLILFHTKTDENLDNQYIAKIKDNLNERELFLIDLITYFDIHSNLLGDNCSLESRLNSINRRKPLDEEFVKYAYEVRDRILDFILSNGNKALIFDVDNTLSFDNQFDQETIKALNYASSKGYEIVFNTGKLPYSIFINEDKLGMEVHKICLNGNIISENKKDLKIIGHINKYKKEIRDYFYKHKIQYIEYTSDGVRLNNEITELNKQKIIDVGDYNIDNSDKEIIKIICFVDEDNKNHRKLIDTFVKNTEISAIRTSKYFYELVPRHTNKGTGMKKMLEELNIYYRASLVFGDNYNDVPMFELAGKPYIMKQAPYYLRHKGYQVIEETKKEIAVSTILNKL